MRNTSYSVVCYILLIKLNILKTSCVLDGHWGNDRLKSGHEYYNSVTGSQTIGPPEPHSTLRLSYAGTTRTAADKEAWLKRRHATIVNNYINIYTRLFMLFANCKNGCGAAYYCYDHFFYVFRCYLFNCDLILCFNISGWASISSAAVGTASYCACEWLVSDCLATMDKLQESTSRNSAW